MAASYLIAWRAFLNWCVASGRLLSNPLAGVPKASEKADRRRVARALTEEELRQLLKAAQERSLVEALTVRRGRRKGTLAATVRPATRERLLMLGRERALIYKTLALTGLRLGELRSLTVGSVELEQALPHLILQARHEKNRQGSLIPLRKDLAGDIRNWLAQRLAALQQKARLAGEAVPARLPQTDPLFTVSMSLLHVFDRDLEAAGIPKLDERGRVLHLHALRHTFATHLARSGASVSTAKAAMRHSSVDLTLQVYTDPRLLDVRGALDALPELPLPEPQHVDEAVSSDADDAGGLHQG